MVERRSTMHTREPRYGTPDEENPEWTKERFERAKSLEEAIPEMAEEIRRTGRPRIASPKVQISIRLDRDVLNAYRAHGRGWQARVNDVLAKAIKKRTPKQVVRRKTRAA